MIIQYVSVLPNSGGVARVVCSIAEALKEHGYATKVISWIPVNRRHQYARRLAKKEIEVAAVNARIVEVFKIFQMTAVYALCILLVLPYLAYRKMGIKPGWQRLKNELAYSLYGRIINNWTRSATFRTLERSIAENIDCILHVHYLGWEQCREVLKWAKKNRVSTIIHYHNDVSFSQDRNHSAFFSNLANLLPEKATIIVLSESLKNRMAARIGAAYHIEAVPNWIEDEQSKPGRTRAVSAPFSICCVTRLVGGKGIEDIVRAIVLLSEENLNVRCTIVGAGLGFGYLTDMAQRLGVSDRMLFTGELPEDSVTEKMRNADVFLLSSSTEGLPIVFIKAMALGLPVIVTPVGANREIVEEAGNGLLVEIGDVRQLAEAIKKMSVDSGLRSSMGAQSREYYETHFTSKVVWPMLENVYKQIL